MTTAQNSGDVVREHGGEAAGAAKDRAAGVASHATGAAADVKDTAVDQARQVKDETVRQAKDLVGEARMQATTQAREQTQRVSGNLNSIADELRKMADNGDGGMAADAAHQIADRAHRAAQYLDGREPGDLLDDVRGFARRRPGAFLAGMAALGFLAGRVGRGVKDASDDGGADRDDVGARRGFAGEPYPGELGSAGITPPLGSAYGGETAYSTEAVGTGSAYGGEPADTGYGTDTGYRTDTAYGTDMGAGNGAPTGIGAADDLSITGTELSSSELLAEVEPGAVIGEPDVRRETTGEATAGGARDASAGTTQSLPTHPAPGEYGDRGTTERGRP